MERNIFYMRRIQMLIDKIKNEKNIEYRKVTYVGVKAIINDLLESNPENQVLSKKTGPLLKNLKWLAHIDDPGHDDRVYIEGIDKSLRELHAGSGIVFLDETRNAVKDQSSL